MRPIHSMAFMLPLVVMLVIGCANPSVKERQSLGVSPAKRVFVASSPEGSEIFLNGELVGGTPKSIGVYTPWLWIGSPGEIQTIEVREHGYEAQTQTFRFVGGPSWYRSVPDSFYFHLKHSAQSNPELALKRRSPALRDDTVSRSLWAVVLGLSRHERPQAGLPDLVYADNDAKAFADALVKLGWSRSYIKLLTNEQATRRNVLIALESWLTKAGPDDTIVLFWSGHGFPDPEDPEKVYFACYDTDVSIPATGWRMDEVRRKLEERGARNVVVLADTCHAGKLITRSGKGLGGVAIGPYMEKLKKEANVPKGWIFMVGADTDRQAIEHSSWSNGAFTHCLLKALSGQADGYQSVGPKDGVVTMDELRAYVNTAMPDETQRVLGTAKRPIITTSSGDPGIWKLSLEAR